MASARRRTAALARAMMGSSREARALDDEHVHGLPVLEQEVDDAVDEPTADGRCAPPARKSSSTASNSAMAGSIAASSSASFEA